MIQYRYLQQQQESMQRHQYSPQQQRSLLQSTFSSSQTQRGIQSIIQDQRRSSQKKVLSRLESSRPLPTPPATKSVRWANYNEVLEIENVDELIQLGYYNGYDRELGWDYRDESLDEFSSDNDDEDEEDFTESESDIAGIFSNTPALTSDADRGFHKAQQQLECLAHITQAESSAARPTRQTPAPGGLAIANANAVTSVVLTCNFNLVISKESDFSHVATATAPARERSFNSVPNALRQ
ncbi:hypothetical protein BGZ70_007442 [Mortierella alpina]|uniref:Uncharacterized protein n=1 Tax=Mortierella alpina TaxID=64518 RepID=A0A9P6J6I7_MORAP|nr:hypothetical protein BGZ70_007442 [Mortierella alpina]